MVIMLASVRLTPDGASEGLRAHKDTGDGEWADVGLRSWNENVTGLCLRRVALCNSCNDRLPASCLQDPGVRLSKMADLMGYDLISRQPRGQACTRTTHNTNTFMACRIMHA